MNTEIKNAKGKLTAYGLACGYVEIKENGSERSKLWKEHGVYHVRVNHSETSAILYWGTFLTLTKARKAFDSKIGNLTLKAVL